MCIFSIYRWFYIQTAKFKIKPQSTTTLSLSKTEKWIQWFVLQKLNLIFLGGGWGYWFLFCSYHLQQKIFGDLFLEEIFFIDILWCLNDILPTSHKMEKYIQLFFKYLIFHWFLFCFLGGGDWMLLFCPIM